MRVFGNAARYRPSEALVSWCTPFCHPYPAFSAAFVRGGVFATGFNLATAPTFAKYGYPQFALSCVTDQAPALIKKYPGLFVFQQSTTTFAKGAISVLKKLKDGGQIGNKVAVVNVGDDFGIELANAGRPLFKEGGFEIVYDKSYPLGTQDYAPVIKAARGTNPDAFIAWSSA